MHTCVLNKKLPAHQMSEILYLEDFQDFIGFLLGDDGIVVETAELTLEPKGIDVSRM